MQATPSRPQGSVNDGNLPIILASAMRQDLELSPVEQRDKIIAKVASFKTRADAAGYLSEVRVKKRAAGRK